MPDLSILIPSRNELFLERTIADILEHSEVDTEIIAILDGAWADPPIPDNPKVTLIYHSQPIGQRAATNEAIKISKGKYIMKCDAHCSFAQGFDKQLLNDIQPNWTIVPTMRNLWAFDWVCEDGHRRYQGPSGVCKDCGKSTKMDIIWIAKENPQSNSYCFDSEPHFQYFKEWNKRTEGKGRLTETMSLQGSCFMISKENYWRWNVCDESFGSWGSQGIEVAVKTWLSGGSVIIDHNTYYAHMFRTQGGDFGFPYPLSGKDVEFAKNCARKLLYSNFHTKTRNLSWLLKKFWPIPGWTETDLINIEKSETVSLGIN